jgi:hypothetical protein
MRVPVQGALPLVVGSRLSSRTRGQNHVGQETGLYVVTARLGEVEGPAQIRVQAPRPDKRVKGDERRGEERNEASVIRWSGSIPPLKWTTFYIKVASPFASVAGWSLRVAIELPAEKDEHQAKGQVEKIRGALRDLGLADDVELFQTVNWSVA